MKIVIPTRVIHDLIHPDPLSTAEIDEIATALAGTLAQLHIHVNPAEIEIVPD